MASFSALYSLEEVPVEWGRPSIECREDTSHQPLVVGLTMSPVWQFQTNSLAGYPIVIERTKRKKVASTQRRKMEREEFDVK